MATLKNTKVKFGGRVHPGDIMSPEKRSALMSRIRGKNTGPEIAVRQLLHRLGYRYRLHGSDLPGRPDIVIRSRHAVIFVHDTADEHLHFPAHSCPKIVIEVGIKRG